MFPSAALLYLHMLFSPHFIIIKRYDLKFRALCKANSNSAHRDQQHSRPPTMHSTNVLLAFGFTMAATTSAAPLSNPTPTIHPLFTVVSRIPASTPSGVANATAAKLPNHEHSPDCEHSYNANHNSTNERAHASTAEDKDDATEGQGHDDESKGYPSPYPGFNASSYAHPHAVKAHNHTGCYRNASSHHNTKATDAVYDKTAQADMADAGAESLRAHPGNGCAHPSHRNGNSTVGHSYDKKSVGPEVNVTVCMGRDCKDSELVSAKVNEAGKLVGMEAKSSKGMVRREDTGFSYEDFARQMSGARIAGGV